MKTFLTTIFILVTTLFCVAKPNKNSVKTDNVVNDNKIPDYVDKWLNSELANVTTKV